MWLASTCAITASTVSASDMMEIIDDRVYCNSTATVFGASVTVTSSACSKATTFTVKSAAASPDTSPAPTTVESSSASDISSLSLESAESSLSPSSIAPSSSAPASPFPASAALAPPSSAPCSPAPSSPAPSSPAPSSPAPSSPAPSSPAPSSPAPSCPTEPPVHPTTHDGPMSPAPSSPARPTSPEPSSPAPSSPFPSLPMQEEYEADATMQDDDAGHGEAYAELEDDEEEDVEGEEDGGDDEYGEYDEQQDEEEDFEEDEYDDEDEEYEDEYEDVEDMDDGSISSNIEAVCGNAEMRIQGDGQDDDDDNSYEQRQNCFASLPASSEEVKHLKSLVLLHLDLVQEQADQLRSKDTMIVKLRDENEVLKHQLDLSNKRLALTLLQLQQNGVQFPLEMQLHQPKTEGTVSPLTIRSQMENGRRRGVVLKSSSSSPQVVSSSYIEGLYGQSLPIRYSEVSSTVSPAKEEFGEELVLVGNPCYQPALVGDDEPEDQEAFIAQNNEVDGEIYLNYSKSDDDESLSPAATYEEEEEDEEEEDAEEEEAEAEEEGAEEEEEEEEEEDDFDGEEGEDDEGEQHGEDEEVGQDANGQLMMQYGEMMEDEEMEGGYELNATGEDYQIQQYVSDEQHAPMMMMMMMDQADVDVAMELNSQPSQESQDSQDSLGTQDSQDSQDSQESQGTIQHAPSGAENVQFFENTGGGGDSVIVIAEEQENEAVVEEQQEQVQAAEERNEQQVEVKEECIEQGNAGAATAAASAMVGDQDTMETTYEARDNETNESVAGGESSEGFTEASDHEGKNIQRQQHHHHRFNPAIHCPSGNSSDGCLAKRSCKPNSAYMITRKQYISCSWKDDAVTAELEKLLSNEAAELEIPSWTVIDDSSQSADEVPSAVSPENISDEAYMKRHMKLEIDERRRKKWDVQRIREQKNIERLKKRQLKEQPNEQEAQKTITTFYPTVDTLKCILITDDVPVQAFGEQIPLLPVTGSFSLPWQQAKSNGGGGPTTVAGPSSFGYPSQFPTGSVDRAGSSDATGKQQHHLPQQGSGISSVPAPAGGLLYETKTKFLHRLAPNLQAQKQRFTKRIKLEM